MATGNPGEMGTMTAYWNGGAIRVRTLQEAGADIFKVFESCAGLQGDVDHLLCGGLLLRREGLRDG